MSSLTFGPKWVRDLSSGDTGAAAPPNTPAPRKYKLADFRYGREEMLSLFSENYEIPLGLKEFEDIINGRPVLPLAFIPVSEEEERCLIGGVNSVLVLKITGRGGPGLRARGGIRGRGRGRGDYTLHRSASSSDGTYEQNKWTETGQIRGGYHRSVSGHNSLEGGPVRVGYDPTRSRLNSDGSFPNRNVEYWRSNSKESPTTETPAEGGDDEWRNNKPWTGKKGSADGNKNWRDAKERDTHEELTRTKSWSHTNHDKEDLPEWCIDDSIDDDTPGSFDASGQFRVVVKDEDNDEDKFHDDAVDPEERTDNDTKKENPDKKENENKEIISTNNDKKIDDSSVELESLQIDNDIDDNNVFSETVDEQMKGDIENESIEVSKVESLHTQTIDIAAANKVPLNERPTEEEYEMNLEHITSMVAKLDDESDEEIMQAQSVANNLNIDPSIVFAKKAEPGKAINGLQDWIYKDPQGEIQGPFSNDEMLEWFKAGYFTMGLLVRRVCDEMFLPLGDVIKLWQRVPFTAKSQPPPITASMLLQHQQQQQQQSQLQRLLQQQQQQQLRQALLQQLQVLPESSRPNDLDLSADLSVWGDASTGTTPVSSATAAWTPMQEQNVWNVRESPQNVLSLRQIEEEQQRQAEKQQKIEQKRQLEQLRQTELGRQTMNVSEFKQSIQDYDVQNKQAQDLGKSNAENQSIAEAESPKKKNKKKNVDKENIDIEFEKKKNETDQKQKEELQRKALEALKHQQQLQQQQKLFEQQRLVDEQNRREEEIRIKQQQQQQQMQQQILLAKYQQEQQRKQQQQSWSRLPATNSAPSLAEIQRIQERKEAELQEHMKAIHQHELMQQQQQRAQARWNQQLSLQQQQQQRIKSLVEIQQEEAKKILQQQMKQQHHHQQQQQQQQQQHLRSQDYNSLPWNAAGQPILAKPSKNDSNSMFWDDVMGLTSRTNGNMSNQQQGKGFNDFPPVSTNNKANKREIKEQEIVNRIFQAPTPSSDFVSWVERNLPAVKKAIDVPTVVAFLQDLESPYEIHEYMRSYLGDSREQKEFVREFLERRNKTEKSENKKASSVKLPSQRGDDNMVNSITVTNSDYDTYDDANKKNKRKKKMQKVDPNLLGFQCNAAPEILNRDGEVESVATAVAKIKK